MNSITSSSQDLTPSTPPAWLAITITLLYYIVYPIFLVLKALLYILLVLSTPFIYIGRLLLDLFTLPWRIFTRFEALWYFLGSAVAIGLVLGLTLHLTMRIFILVFHLDQKSPSAPQSTSMPKPIPATGHDAASYRKAREGKKKQAQAQEQESLVAQAKMLASQPLIQEVVREARKMPLSTGSLSPLGPPSPSALPPSFKGLGLSQETILEHTDEEDDDSVF
ncbi:hypothetical protein PV10_08838 [Exophiala mesophila]|uniref:Uncharacterized protein n=1 Tax=Exophiala mesophila TaxID=212818 RepID=A0A0D1Z5U1_EXOME|nr:uncharacterized protein PV10_08838 [Exophiala mesophila]KIV89259.1 hypothetical protein PV10_08838 [Exophiala mesophila]